MLSGSVLDPMRRLARLAMTFTSPLQRPIRSSQIWHCAASAQSDTLQGQAATLT